MNNQHKAFFDLLKAGLWEQDLRLLPYGEVDYQEITCLAEEQAVEGLVTAGLKRVTDMKVPKVELLSSIGDTLQIEEQNKAMNCFIGELINKMRSLGIYPLLVKGQGIAQCYARPLWRTSGDVDFFLNDDNYSKAKDFLVPLASSVELEGQYAKHLGMTIDSWIVELHGSLRCGLSRKMDRVIDEAQYDVFKRGNVRSWMNGNTQVFLPGVDCDILFVFTHFIKHYYLSGLVIRQICDWIRLLWTYREVLDKKILESRIRKMGLLTEWKTFGAFAVVYLGMPVDAMPLYSPDKKWKQKADGICSFIMNMGNMGQKRDNSYFYKYPYVIRKAISLGRRCGDLIEHARLFPLDSLRFFPNIVFHGIMAATRGE